MFHGHTLVECQADEAMIMRLMSEPEDNRRRMGEFLARVERECVAASLDCVPENASAVTQGGVVQAQGLLTVDSQHWTPEVPERIGLYHAYIRGFNRDVRTHRLFIVCSGGMARASDAFCNMVIDGGRDWTAHVCHFSCGSMIIHLFWWLLQDICESQEAWWLRKGCRRARCRLIKSLADAFDIPVKAIQVSASLDLALEHVLHGEGLQQRAPQGVQDGFGLAGLWDWVTGVKHFILWGTSLTK
jgi:hypothetical protein